MDNFGPMIADALLARGVTVAHIMGKTSVIVHEPTSFARGDGVKVTCPAEKETDHGDP